MGSGVVDIFPCKRQRTCTSQQRGQSLDSTVQEILRYLLYGNEKFSEEVIILYEVFF